RGRTPASCSAMGKLMGSGFSLGSVAGKATCTGGGGCETWSGLGGGVRSWARIRPLGIGVQPHARPPSMPRVTHLRKDLLNILPPQNRFRGARSKFRFNKLYRNVGLASVSEPDVSGEGDEVTG